VFEQLGAVAVAARVGVDHELGFAVAEQCGRDVADREQFAGAGRQFDEAAVGERRLAVGARGALDEHVEPVGAGGEWFDRHQFASGVGKRSFSSS
jgi:hypothetical protein